MCETISVMQGKMLKEQASIKKFDAKTAYPLVKSFPESIGVNFEVLEESSQRVVCKGMKWPVSRQPRCWGWMPKPSRAPRAVLILSRL